MNHLNAASLLDMSLIIVEDKGLPKTKGASRIDIWWRGRENGSLMVLLAHLLTLNWDWAGVEIRLLRLIDGEAGREPSTRALWELVEQARIKAEVQVLVSDSPFSEILARHLADASVVFLGFNVPEQELAPAFQSYFTDMISRLPTTILVSSSGKADLFA
ncbi:MAG: hypothetical protein JW932_09740 [Deltaproteobacteria bacterium]|nr:hypothetical protein [Deltaproteobacteria bacterium]